MERRAQKSTALIFLLLCSFIFSACGSRPNMRLPLLTRTPLEAANIRVDRALDDATIEASSQDRYLAKLRYNPATCACPPWEAELFGRWQRVDLQPEPPRAKQSMREAWVIVGPLWTESSTGWRYPVLRWQDEL